ncbi:MAG TPA: sulfotransferase domain-containing protein, partial [Longimicrobiales bacterium]|nr:sulfotransferase domain-containing protein [Longimicrobiales bacterium]
IVVSGLPRSGTSMMMQMLHAGGVETVTDGRRTADESNPEGYFELERVKSLETDPDMSWLRDARGRAVKIITFLLEHLPETLNYKIIFMNRALDEVLTSQTKMLDRLGEESETEDARMFRLYVNHLARTRTLLTHRSWFEVLHLRYDEVVTDGVAHARQVARFLGRALDVEAMAGVIRPDLYRNRRG